MAFPEPGSIVVINFPFSDLSDTKRRPAMVLADVGKGDLILCQITSKSYADPLAIAVDQSDYDEGRLPLKSYVRPGKLFTASYVLLQGVSGRVNPEKHCEVLDAGARGHVLIVYGFQVNQDSRCDP